MSQRTFIEYAVGAMESERRMNALFLGGSFGRGSDDEFSDLDFVALAGAAYHVALTQAWREAIAAFAPIVYWNQRSGGGILLNAITEDWLRIDLWLTETTVFVSALESPNPRYARSTLKPLIDRRNITSKLPATVPAVTNRDAVEHVINEFIRVLGLIAVGMGRGENVLGVTGAGLLRDLLTRLMVEETHSAERGGLLHLSRTVTPEQLEVLHALPYPEPRRDSVLAAHWATAAAFFPRARALSNHLGIAWPTAFEDATKRHLQRAFREDFTPW